jgi:hypothetical protein
MLRRVALVRTDKNQRARNVSSNYEPKHFELLVSANVVPSSPIIVTLMMEARYSSESSVLSKATLRNIPEGGILLQEIIFAARIQTCHLFN